LSVSSLMLVFDHWVIILVPFLMKVLTLFCRASLSCRNPLTTWTNFKNTLNQWGRLEWLTEEPSKQTNFLNLTIHLQQNKITTSTYQKELNLYLYIPPLSAHPSSCFKGLINGEIFKYWTQNSPDNFVNLLSKFIERLVQGGHSIEKLAPLVNLSLKTT